LALGLQGVLGDLFASLTIIFDKPFAVGDYI
jgi:small-conductance mechanosensitive channel